MKVVAFIEPPQPDVIGAILKHCGLWQSRSARAPRPQELTYVAIETILANF